MNLIADDIAHGHFAGADWCFLIALICFAIAGIIWISQVMRATVHAQAAHAAHALVAIGLCVQALGWLIL